MTLNQKIKVSDVMTRSPIIATPVTSLLDCAKLMVKKKTGSLLVVDNNRLVGFVTNDDILWALVRKSKKDLSSIKAIDIAVKKIATIKPEAPLSEALTKMKKFKFRRLPVIQNGKLVGIITMRDILSFTPEIYPELNEIEMLREEEEKLKRFREAKTRKTKYEGICEECGNGDILFEVDGRMICESCRSGM
ncbi:hypothetical protein COU57_04580 [Candidatus Pacearchaeota archaeon CG10_big_fil_rev_8_21_14_0_10_32_14]|nr:MAG: hypothetical protein COU57_04580 [Candidatus Pacearchaeota archaeon CG10_big_fil_rev_8_21_14_0_10_32_14]